MASTSRPCIRPVSRSDVTSSSEFKKIIIGICAMQRKARSKPMCSIMTKMCEYYKDYLDFVVFPEEVIINEPVENWPLCDCLISFHSTDFPLKKAIEYEKLRRPYVLNDLYRQFDLLDRRKVFRTLARAGIDHPRHCVLMRNEQGELIGNELHEHADHIEVNGMVFNKPFVEKPVSAEDHNIYIYYPSSVGGGSQRLFRKINDRASWYSPVSTVRQEGSYIYEEFIPADGTDVKVYAVGPYYAHAEARKAPGLDGKVERDADGKEVRYPVILSAKEKTIARRVVLAFGSVCGFDLLRANGRSYVCDVNGFSFVKTSTKYYEDTAKILGNTILRRLATSLSIPWHIPFQDDDPPLVSTPSGKIMELRCVLAVIRHGDRTPKQKMKVPVRDARFFRMFQKYDGMRKKEIKMKRPNQLMEVLEIVRELLHENQVKRKQLMDGGLCAQSEEAKSNGRELEKCEEHIKTFEQMRTVLEMYGHFSGINRKVQLKYVKPKADNKGGLNGNNSDGKEPLALDTTHSSSSLDEHHMDGNNKQQAAVGKENDGVPTLLVILKWGGELTTAGVLQAEALGKLFRTLYPGIRRTDGKDSPEDTQGLGFLRLHSTFRHDLKIYSSDEGRVQMTAAAFAKGLLALEGELTPILMQMVKSANTDGLLNDDYNARQFQDDIKSFLHATLQADRDFTPADYQALNPSGLRSLSNAMEFIKNPRKMCNEIAGYVQRMCEIIRWHKLNNTGTDRTLYLNETWELAERRWSKELREFRKSSKNGGADFDISKIPDIYDNIKYDMEHNPDLCINNEGEFERFYLCVKNMADIVVPQEYGVSEESKICIAQRVCTPLLAKIRNDLHRCVQSASEEAGDESLTRLDPRASEGIATPMRHVRTRLYFTSESHIHTLMNLIRYGGLCSPDDKKWQRAMNFLSGVTEFNYMTQLVLMVYEDSRHEEDEAAAAAAPEPATDGSRSEQQQQQNAKKKDHKDRFHIELLFSPGLYPCFQTEKERIYESRYSNRHKSSTDGKAAKGSSKHSGHTLKKQSSTGTQSNGGGGAETALNGNASDKDASSENGTFGLGVNNHTLELDSGALSDYSQTSEAPPPTRKSSTVPKASPEKQGAAVAALLDPEVEEPQTTPPAADAVVKGRREHKESAGSFRQNSGTDDEDDLTEENAVNLVVLDEVSVAGKSDLARHNVAPLRKRHATYERDLLENGVENHPPAGAGAPIEPSAGERVGTEERKFEQKRRTSIDELIKRIICQRQISRSDEAAPTPQHSVDSTGELGASRRSGESRETSTTKDERHKSGSAHRQHQKAIVKSMSEVFCEHQKHSLSQSVESPDEESSGGLEQSVDDLLRVDEGQATVGHGRGEWAKQLLAEGKKEQEKDSGPLKAALSAHIENGAAKASIMSSGSRVPLSSLFTTKEDCCCGGEEEQSDKGGRPRDRIVSTIEEEEHHKAAADDLDGAITFKAAQNGRDAENDKTSNKTKQQQQSGGLLLKVGAGDSGQNGKINTQPSTSTIKDDEAEDQSRSMRRPRFPYRFKHHTVNLLTAATENRLISTDVLLGKFSDKSKRKASSNSVVLATAVIGRSSSAPRLQTYNAGDELIVNEIRRFWPPLRSLETMHDNIGIKSIDQFLQRMMKNNTPLPSPPKTPVQYDNSMLSLPFNKDMEDNTICRLSPMDH